MSGVAIGCFVVVVAALLGIVLQAAFLHWGAKLSNAGSPFSKAVTATLIMLAIGLAGGLGYLFYAVLKVPELSDKDINLHLLALTLASIIVNILVVSKVYTVGYAKGLRIYVTSILLILATEVALIAVLVGILWAAVGRDKLQEAFEESRAAVEQRRLTADDVDEGAAPDLEKPIPLLEAVSDETPANAFDIELSRASNYIGKTVRVIHGPRSESIGTLLKVTPTQIFVSVKINGGSVQIPINKSRITTFQRVDTSIKVDEPSR